MENDIIEVEKSIIDETSQKNTKYNKKTIINNPRLAAKLEELTRRGYFKSDKKK